MRIKRLISACLEENGYLLYQREGGNGWIIDPGDRADRFLAELKALRLRPAAILLTHHHYDHVGAVDEIVRRTGCPIYIHRLDLAPLKKEAAAIEDGHCFDIDGEELRTILTPGHTHGSVCYYAAQSRLAFTGDTIFNVDLGRTDLEDGSPREMAASIRRIIAGWDDDIEIWPGHGDHCSMRAVRRQNREYLDLVGR
ncbi:MAG: MBL fold metallo-hydrolase [Anaerovoracaceae bacterium]|jgi:hydroxyacylglutathione hydrolase